MERRECGNRRDSTGSQRGVEIHRETRRRASYDKPVAGLMKREGIEDPTPAERQRFDRRRKKSQSNQDWVNPHDPEARITKRKDGPYAAGLQSRARRGFGNRRGGGADGATGRPGREMEAVGPVQEVNQVGVERVIADRGITRPASGASGGIQQPASPDPLTKTLRHPSLIRRRETRVEEGQFNCP
jgi:hypothetical protein